MRTRVTDKDLTLLKKFPNLTYLDLQRTETSAAGLAHLKSLRKLEYLVLSPQMTDEGLPHLANFMELRSLCLAQTQVTGVGFAPARPDSSRGDRSDQQPGERCGTQGD